MRYLLDSRELVERRDELLEEKGVADLDDDDDDSAEVLDAVGKLNGFTEKQQEELTELEAVISEIGEDYAVDGVTLIPESEFVEYAEQLCKDCGDLPQDIPHYIVIDWDATADNIQQDYSAIDFEGKTYLYRV
jgi:hypothetical protein